MGRPSLPTPLHGPRSHSPQFGPRQRNRPTRLSHCGDAAAWTFRGVPVRRRRVRKILHQDLPNEGSTALCSAKSAMKISVARRPLAFDIAQLASLRCKLRATRERGAGNVPAHPFELSALVAGYAHCSLQGTQLKFSMRREYTLDSPPRITPNFLGLLLVDSRAGVGIF